MRRVAVFSDVHGNLEALTAIINDIEKENIDEIISLGDIIAIGPDSKKCLDLVIQKNIRLLLGNHELYYLGRALVSDEGEANHHRWIAKQLEAEYKNKLQFDFEYSIFHNNKKISFFHFFMNKKENNFYKIEILNDETIYDVIKSADYDYAFFGHHHYTDNIITHDKKCFHVETAGCRHDSKTIYLIIELNDEINVIQKEVTYDRDKFLSRIIPLEYPEKELVEKIFFGINND